MRMATGGSCRSADGGGTAVPRGTEERGRRSRARGAPGQAVVSRAPPGQTPRPRDVVGQGPGAQRLLGRPASE
jgi:hypothetical protein